MIVDRDVQTNAKTAELVNPVTGKQAMFTGVFFDVRSNEELKLMQQMFIQKDFKIKNVKGVQIPFHYLPKYAKPILDVLPNGCFTLSDLCMEVIYFGGIADEKKGFYFTSNLFPDEVKQKMHEIQDADSHVQKIALHKQAWHEITTDKKLLLKLITNFVREQMRFRLDFISVPTPLIIDTAHLDFVEECYQMALNTYNSPMLDIEKEQGRILALYLNIHKNFLSKEANVEELLKTVKRLSPKAIIYKISDMDDIRSMPELIDGWVKLVRGLGQISNEDGIPTMYICTSVEGLIAMGYGTDCISQPFYKTDNIERGFALKSDVMKKLWSESKGTLSAGKISLYDDKEMIKRLEFETLLQHAPPPIPMPEIEPLTYDSVHSMTNSSFRNLAKRVLLFQRNMETEEIIIAIRKGEVRLMKGKFRKWMKTLELFP